MNLFLLYSTLYALHKYVDRASKLAVSAVQFVVVQVLSTPLLAKLRAAQLPE
jgi:hypothetical protein